MRINRDKLRLICADVAFNSASIIEMAAKNFINDKVEGERIKGRTIV